jgi:hypothetical protein
VSIDPVVIDSTTLCQSFPVLGQGALPREHLIQAIDMVFEGGTEAISVEGQEGLGKTTILALYAQSQRQNSVSVFLRPSSRWTSDPDVVVLDLATQLEWLLTGEVVGQEYSATPASLRKLFHQVGKKALLARRKFVVVVDGLCDANRTAADVSPILDLLPIGNQHYRFLFSGDLRTVSHAVRESVKTFPLSPLTPEETTEFLAPRGLDPADAIEIHRTCRGIPGYLASIRRLLESGMSVRTLLEEVPPDLSKVFEMEWQRFGASEPWHELVLGIIAHDARRHTISDVAAVVDVDPRVVADFVASCPMLIVAGDQNEVRFASDLLRRVGENRLKGLKPQVLALIIQYLTRNPQSKDATTYLPGYYRAANLVDEVITVLSPEFFSDTLRITESVGVARQHCSLGIEAAREANRPADAIRFQLHSAALADSAAAGINELTIRAYAALQMHDESLALARAATLRERRFQGLAFALSAQAHEGSGVDDDVLRELRSLHSEIDVRTLGDEAFDVAAALIDVAPDIAIKVVETVAENETDSVALDQALLRLTLLALRDGPEGDERSTALERIRLKISDPSRLLKNPA